MGKTVESFRMALEGEINRWSGFARALRKPERKYFSYRFVASLMQQHMLIMLFQDTCEIARIKI